MTTPSLVTDGCPNYSLVSIDEVLQAQHINQHLLLHSFIASTTYNGQTTTQKQYLLYDLDSSSNAYSGTIFTYSDGGNAPQNANTLLSTIGEFIGTQTPTNPVGTLTPTVTLTATYDSITRITAFTASGTPVENWAIGANSSTISAGFVNQAVACHVAQYTYLIANQLSVLSSMADLQGTSGRTISMTYSKGLCTGFTVTIELNGTTQISTSYTVNRNGAQINNIVPSSNDYALNAALDSYNATDVTMINNIAINQSTVTAFYESNTLIGLIVAESTSETVSVNNSASNLPILGTNEVTVTPVPSGNLQGLVGIVSPTTAFESFVVNSNNTTTGVITIANYWTKTHSNGDILDTARKVLLLECNSDSGGNLIAFPTNIETLIVTGDLLVALKAKRALTYVTSLLGSQMVVQSG